MALRHDERPERCLSPEEARAFLQVHAEREAADAPRVEDLAETLGLSTDEAAAILREARIRTGNVRSQAPRGSKLVWVGLAALSLFWLGLATFYTRASVPPALVVTPGVVAPPPAFEAPPATTPAPTHLVSYGFVVEVDSGTAQFETSDPPATFGSDLRKLGRSEAAEVRDELVRQILDGIESVRESGREWDDARRLTLRVRQTGGRFTTLVVPLKPFTLPLGDNPGGKADLRATLARVLEAAWPQIVRSAPS